MRLNFISAQSLGLKSKGRLVGTLGTAFGVGALTGMLNGFIIARDVISPLKEKSLEPKWKWGNETQEYWSNRSEQIRKNSPEEALANQLGTYVAIPTVAMTSIAVAYTAYSFLSN